MFFRVASLALIAVLAFGGWYLFTKPENVFDVEGEELGSSLAREVEAGGGACAPRKGDRYRCAVRLDVGNRSRQAYQLTFDGDDCWKARPRGKGSQGSGQLTGCVSLSDFLLPEKFEDG